MANNDSTRNSTRNLIIGLLLGTGGSGAAIAVLGKEGSQSYGLVALTIFVSAAVYLHVRREKAEEEERKRYYNMNLLNGHYVDCFGTIGDFIFVFFQSKKKITIQDIFNTLANELSTRGEATKKVASKELADLFREGTNEIADKWKEIASKKIAEEGFPPEAPHKEEK